MPIKRHGQEHRMKKKTATKDTTYKSEIFLPAACSVDAWKREKNEKVILLYITSH